MAFSSLIELFSAKPGKVEDTWKHGFRPAILTEADPTGSQHCSEARRKNRRRKSISTDR